MRLRVARAAPARAAVALAATTLLAAALPEGALASSANAMELCSRLALDDVAGPAGLVFLHDPGGSGDKHLPESMGAGLAWLDWDGDGWSDLYVVQSGPFPPAATAPSGDRLFRNRGDGTFEDVSSRVGLGPGGYGQGVVAVDVDGDSWTDLYLTRFGPDVFLRNRGDGTFEDRTAAFGLGLGGWSSSAAFADADGDGDLDLYVSRYLDYDPAEKLYCGDLDAGERRYCDPALFAATADRFYRHDGERFSDATAAAGLIVDAAGKGLGVVFLDLDGDAQPDLYVANDLTPNFLFRNRGAGIFEDLSLLSGAAANREGLYEAGMGIAAGDVDGDGDADLVVTNFDVETNTFYANLGGMQFADAAAASGFGVPSFNLLGFGVVLADFDRDGALDAYVANGHIFEKPPRSATSHAQRDLLLPGAGRGSFRELACPALARQPRVGRGLAAADFDRDGDVDLAIANNGGPLQLRRNGASAAAAGNWLGVELRGSPPNTAAVGAVVDLVDATGRRQRRFVMAGDSYQSSSERRLLFGLGEAEPAMLEVRWPSGERRRIIGVPKGRQLTVGR